MQRTTHADSVTRAAEQRQERRSSRGGIFHFIRYNNINDIRQLIDVFISLFLNSPDLRKAK